jgi:hypothetical protein
MGRPPALTPQQQREALARRRGGPNRYRQDVRGQPYDYRKVADRRLALVALCPLSQRSLVISSRNRTPVRPNRDAPAKMTSMV